MKILFMLAKSGISYENMTLQELLIFQNSKLFLYYLFCFYMLQN